LVGVSAAVSLGYGVAAEIRSSRSFGRGAELQARFPDTISRTKVLFMAQFGTLWSEIFRAEFQFFGRAKQFRPTFRALAKKSRARMRETWRALEINRHPPRLHEIVSGRMTQEPPCFGAEGRCFRLDRGRFAALPHRIASVVRGAFPRESSPAPLVGSLQLPIIRQVGFRRGSWVCGNGCAG